jgi:hypothetical protein
MAQRTRADFKTAARGVAALLLMLTLLSGFSERDGLVTGSAVAGTPTVGILGLAAANGTEISGEIVSLGAVQGKTQVTLSTTAGYVTVQLADPLLTSGLGVGLTVTFVGEYDSADTFSATQVRTDTLAAASELNLGDPLGTAGVSALAPTGLSLGSAPKSSGSTISTTTSSGKITKSGTTVNVLGTPTTSCTSKSSNSSDCPTMKLSVSDERVDAGEPFTLSLEASGKNGIDTMWWWATSTDDPTLSETHSYACLNATTCKKNREVSTLFTGSTTFHAQARDVFGQVSKEQTVDVRVRGTSVTPTSTCSSSLPLTISPEKGSAKAGTPYQVTVSLGSGISCAGQRVYLRVESGPNAGSVPVATALVNSNNQATLSYTGLFGGEDSIRVWLDYIQDGVFSSGEPNMLGKVTWTGNAKPPPTATPTPTPRS